MTFTPQNYQRFLSMSDVSRRNGGTHLLHKQQERSIQCTPPVSSHSEQLESCFPEIWRMLLLPRVFVPQLAINLVEIAGCLQRALAKLAERLVSSLVLTASYQPSRTFRDKPHEYSKHNSSDNTTQRPLLFTIWGEGLTVQQYYQE